MLCVGSTIPDFTKKDRKPKLLGVNSSLEISEIPTPFLGFIPPFLSKMSLNAQNCKRKLVMKEKELVMDLEKYKVQED